MKNLLVMGLVLLGMFISFAQDRVEYTDFLIAENPKEKYEGIYKNGQPFSGYFKAEPYINGASFVDFYENGERKFRYYFNFLKNEGYFEKHHYDIKNEYENGKIKNGLEFNFQDTALILKEFQDFKRTKIHLVVHTLYYFNIISFEVKDDVLKISEFLGEDWRLEIKKVKNYPYEITIYHKDKVFFNQEPRKLQEVSFASPNSITYYYKNKKINQLEIKTYKRIEYSKEEEKKLSELYGNGKILRDIFYTFNANMEDSVEDLLERIYQNMQGANFLYTESFQKFFEDNNTDLEFISRLDYDKNGKIEDGAKVTPNANGTYKLEIFGKEKEAYPQLSLDEIKKIIDEGIVVE